MWFLRARVTCSRMEDCGIVLKSSQFGAKDFLNRERAIGTQHVSDKAFTWFIHMIQYPLVLQILFWVGLSCLGIDASEVRGSLPFSLLPLPPNDLHITKNLTQPLHHLIESPSISLFACRPSESCSFNLKIVIGALRSLFALDIVLSLLWVPSPSSQTLSQHSNAYSELFEHSTAL